VLAKPGYSNMLWSLRPSKQKIRDTMEALLHQADWVGGERRGRRK